jgi:hypothetical protein
MATSTVQNDPIFALPNSEIFGLNISVASTTVLAIAPGQTRDSTDSIDMPVSLPNLQGAIVPAVLFQNYSQPLLINAAKTGVNGLDTGSLGVSLQYSVWLIGDSRGYLPVAGLLSLTSSNLSPLMPQGYDSLRLIGFIETDGSSHFVYATHKPQNMVNFLQYYNQPPLSVLSGGTATTFTAIDLTTNAAVPTTTLANVIVGLLVTFTPVAVGDVVQFRPTGQTAASVTITGIAAGVAQTQYVVMIAGVGSSKPEIDYLVTSSSDSVSVVVAKWGGASNTAYPALV